MSARYVAKRVMNRVTRLATSEWFIWDSEAKQPLTAAYPTRAEAELEAKLANAFHESKKTELPWGETA